jgi:hypothetical protein
MEILIILAVIAVIGWFLFLREDAPAPTAAPYKVETPPTPEPAPLVVAVSDAVVPVVEAVQEAVQEAVVEAPVKKPRKPRAPKAEVVATKTPAVKKAAPVKKAAAIKAAPKKPRPKTT